MVLLSPKDIFDSNLKVFAIPTIPAESMRSLSSKLDPLQLEITISVAFVGAVITAFICALPLSAS